MIVVLIGIAAVILLLSIFVDKKTKQNPGILFALLLVAIIAILIKANS